VNIKIVHNINIVAIAISGLRNRIMQKNAIPTNALIPIVIAVLFKASVILFIDFILFV